MRSEQPPRRRKTPANPPTLRLLLAGSTVTDVAASMPKPCSHSYISRMFSGRDNFSDALFGTLVSLVGAETAISIRELSAEARAERRAS